MSWMHNAQSQPLTVDPELIVPLPDKFDIEMPAPDVPPEIARFHGAWVGTWGEDIRHILVVERVKPDGRADVVFAHGNSAFYGMYREWWRSEAGIADGVLTITGEALKMPAFRILQFAFDGPGRLFHTSTFKWGSVIAGLWPATMRRGLLRAIDRSNGPGPASACRYRTSTCGRPMVSGRSCSKRPCTGQPGLVRRRSRSSRTDPTPAAISSGAGRWRSRRIGFATRDLPCWR